MTMHTISMHTTVSSLTVRFGSEKKEIKNDGIPISMNGVVYTLSSSGDFKMESASEAALKEVEAFFSYDKAKFRSASGEEKFLKSSAFSKRIINKEIAYKLIFREIGDKWRGVKNPGEVDLLSKLKKPEPSISTDDLGPYKTMADIYKHPARALQFFEDKYKQETRDAYRNDYRRIIKGIKALMHSPWGERPRDKSGLPDLNAHPASRTII